MTKHCSHTAGIRHVVPSAKGCEECLRMGSPWVHLRICRTCGHVGCCDDSPNKHATKHFHQTRHPVIRSFEPGEDWFWSYPVQRALEGPSLAPPSHRPLDQPVPGPAGHVPPDWQDLLH